MFPFWGDTVLDPFCGTGTTLLAALNCGRRAIGVDIDPSYVDLARDTVAQRRLALAEERADYVVASETHLPQP